MNLKKCCIVLALFVIQGLEPPSMFAENQPHRFVIASWLVVPMNYKPGQLQQDQVKDDIRAAMEEGLDGFALDVFNGSQARSVFTDYMRAADELGARQFKCFLSADMSLGFSAEDVVDTVKEFAGNPHYLRIGGKPLLSTFGGEDKGDEWWQREVLQPLASSGHPVTFTPSFDRPHPNWDVPSYDAWRKTIAVFPSADGLFNFLIPGSTPFHSNDSNLGNHLWSTIDAEENLARALHDVGKLFISTYMPYYWAVCHPVRQYMEYQAGRGMANTWSSIVTKQKPDLVEIVTWNDYSESTYIQPTRIPLTQTPEITSYSHLAFYELLKYYISWYKTDVQPTIISDAVFYFYRPNTQNSDPNRKDTYCSLGPVHSNVLFGNLTNDIYVTTALVSAARLRIVTGDQVSYYDVPSGITTTNVPFKQGSQIIELWRGDSRILRTEGHPIIPNTLGDNFNVFSAYQLAGDNGSSSRWLPTDAWKTGFVANWFRR